MVTTRADGRSSFTQVDESLDQPGNLELTTHKINYDQCSSPISRIPPEVLSVIFLHLSDQWPTKYGWKESDSSVVLGWATVSHVSRRWRAVSLNFPCIWSSLCLQSPKWTKLQLERTRNAPISLRVPGHLEERGRAVFDEILSSHMHRLQHLSVLLTDERLTEDLANTLSSVSAPQLESLTLKRSPKLINFLISHDPDLIVPSDNLLSKGAPSLRRLALTSWDIAWSSPVLTRLTSLAISSHLKFLGFRGLAASDMLDCLDRMPYLEELVLSMPLPEFDAPIMDRVVELRSLRKLELRAECHDCEALLRHLAFPSSASVDLSCMGFRNPPSPIMMSRMISAVHSAPTRLGGQKSTATTIRKLEIFKPIDHFVFTLQPTSADKTACNAAWSVCFDGSNSSMETFLSLLPLAGLRSVSLDAIVGNGVLEILSNLPSLTSLWLVDDNAPRFLAYMHEEDPPMLQAWPLTDMGLPSLSGDDICANHPSTITRFVGLTELGFEDIQICHNIHEKTFWDFTKVDEGQLLRFLSIRSMHMKPIQKILFGECVALLHKKLELLRIVVPYVLYT